MNIDQLQALGLAAQRGTRGTVESATAGELHTTPHNLAPLVREGLLVSRENSEQVRGERRFYWQEYRITEAGMAAYAWSLNPNGQMMTKQQVKQAYNRAEIGLSDALPTLMFDHNMTLGDAYKYLGL